MICISCRANFSAVATFGPHCSRVGDRTTPGYSQSLGGAILIHGYHNTDQAAEQSYADIAARFTATPLTGYLWPGGDIAIDFPLAVIRAREAGWRLRDMLNGCRDAGSIDIQTHSLGARVALEALKYGGVQIRHLILSAPAVDYDSLEPEGEFGAVLANCASVNVFHSSNDPVLKTDYPLGSFGRLALGSYGTVAVRPRLREFDCSALVQSHGGYRYCPAYFEAWKAIVDGTASPGSTVLR